MPEALFSPHEETRLGSRIVGNQPTYWAGRINHCPGCSYTSWIVGRYSAECGFCRTALAMEHSGMLGMGTFLRNDCSKQQRCPSTHHQ